MKRSFYALALIAVLPGCKDEKKVATDEPYEPGKVPAFLVGNHDIDQDLIDNPEAMDEDDMPGSKRKRREGGDFVAAEFKKGASKWKDTGIYIDGKPVGVLNWGELP